MKTAIYMVSACLLMLLLARAHQSMADDTEESAQSTVTATITALEAERAKLIAELGPDHPRVKAIDTTIALTALRLTTVKKDVTEMSEVELRQAVQQLLRRVSDLEKDVSVLKERRPKVELLGR